MIRRGIGKQILIPGTALRRPQGPHNPILQEYSETPTFLQLLLLHYKNAALELIIFWQ